MTELTEIMQEVWSTGKVPKSWGLSRLSCLWKNKGSRKDPDMYRGLSISSSLCKLAVCIVLARQNKWYEAQMSEPQHGFRNSRGTQDAIYTVKTLQQITHKMKTKVYAAFVDLTAAFDTIQRSWLFKILRSRLGDPDCKNLNINVLESLYSSTSAHLSNDEETLAFEILAGVRQGGPESPSLFCLLMDWVMRIFELRAEKIGLKGVQLQYNIPGSATSRLGRDVHPARSTADTPLNLLWAGFADDLFLSFTTEADLKTGLDLLAQIFDEFDLHISEKKTETIILNDESDPENYPKSLHSINGIELKNVQVFKYLGSQIQYDQPATGDTEVKSRIDLAKGKFESLKHILQNRKIHMWIRMLFYNSLIRSRLTYACQTWSLSQKQFALLNSTHAHFLRRMINNGFKRLPNNTDDPEKCMPYHYHNTDIFQICKSAELADFINKQRQKFAAHIIRSSNSRHAKQLMFNSDKYHLGGNRLGTLLDQVVVNSQTERGQFIRSARNREF